MRTQANFATGSRGTTPAPANWSCIYAYETRPAELIEPYASQFCAYAEAWTWFQAQPPSYRRTLTWWVISAKQEATRQSRLQRLIAESAAGRRMR